MKLKSEKENCNPETMLECVVATRQLWRWVPPWRYGLGLLMKHVCNILIYHPAKSQYSIMIWRCCSRPWMPRGSAPQESENINTQGGISLNVFTRNASNKSNEDGMHSLYSQPWQYPQRWDFKASMWHRSSSWNVLFITSNHKKIQVSFSEKLITTRTEKACTIFFGEMTLQFYWFRAPKAGKQAQLAKEIELHPEISVITR